MAGTPILYYITDRRQFSGEEVQRRQKLLAKIYEAASCGLDFIQLREKDLSSRELESLAAQIRHVLDDVGTRTGKRVTRFLVNSRIDVALAVGADGVHLTSHDISIRDARKAYAQASSSGRKSEIGNWIVAASCHSVQEVRAAAEQGADFVVFGPVFEKKNGATPTGLDTLRRACECDVPVFALGGITLENARSCLEVGAAGVAGIRLLQENNIPEVIRIVRGHSIR